MSVSDERNGVVSNGANVQVISEMKHSSAEGGNGDSLKADDTEADMRCGYGSFKPQCLQMFNNPKIFLVWMCWFAFLQGFVVNGINNVNTSSVERRFELKSSKVGLVSSAYDISAGFFVLPITFYGTHGHQPRMLALSAFIMALGSITMSLPHFITGPYELGNSLSDRCDIYANSSLCSDEGSNLPNYLYLLMLGQFLHGIGGTTLYTLGFVFIDANVRHRDSPLYQGILLGFAALGPAAGYLLGGILLEKYVDFDVVDTGMLAVSPTDARWVGAWWLGFLSAGCITFTTVLVVLPYPPETPDAKIVRKENISQAHHDERSQAVTSREGFMTSWRDIPSSLRVLLTNPVLMFVTFGGVTEGIAVSGFATFLPKFIQNQFSQTASWSAMLSGFILVPGAVGGNILGGAISKIFNLKIRGLLYLCIFSCLTALVCSLSLLLRCDNETIAGITVNYDINSELGEVNLTSGCNAGCGCTSLSYEPVCGVNGVQYFSPCHAGCTHSSTAFNKKVYTNCSCVNNTSHEFAAEMGTCGATCRLMQIFLPFLFILILTTFLAEVSTLSITLRCIPSNQRAFALGVQAVCSRYLGTVPGPILFGYVFDSACTQWQDHCEQGSCWIYDNKTLSINITILAIVVKIFSTSFFSLALFFYKPPTSSSDLTKSNTVDNLNEVIEQYVAADKVDNGHSTTSTRF